jgi:hypothetical protein
MACDITWSLQGDALLLNWAEFCIQKGRLYARDVYKRYRQTTTPNITAAPIRHHICWLVENTVPTLKNLTAPRYQQNSPPVEPVLSICPR